jgi:DNA polymerase I-like protein with 3'-5' exonuclease and polymerase domains
MGQTDDTMTRAALIDEHLLEYNLDTLCNKYIGMRKDIEIYTELSAIFGGKANRNTQVKNFPDAPIEIMSRYGKRDTRAALNLWEWQEEEIIRQDLITVADLERRLFPVLVDMEHRGVRINVEGAERAVDTLTSMISAAQAELDAMAGFKVNPNPSNSIKQLFNPVIQRDGTWKLIDGTIVESTPGGKAQINSDVLRIMKHPAAAKILSLRKMLKTRDTFLLGHMLGNHHNGVIHCNYNSTKSDNDLGTGTGRLSVNGPALQQIHKRDVEIASVVRALFLPDEGDDWVCNDWAQMDFRVMAHYVNDANIIRMYEENPDTDFHQATADLTGLPRSPRFAGDASAKQTNLSLTFGQGMGSFAKEIGLPYTVSTGRGGKKFLRAGPEAEEIFRRYHAAIPGIKDMLDNASRLAKLRGYVVTIMGRKIRFPRGYKAYKAGGLIFQGSAADALKVKLVEVYDLLKGTNGRLMLNVHDEFDTSIPHDEFELKKAISHKLESFNGVDCSINFRVPIRTNQGVGPDWWSACK